MKNDEIAQASGRSSDSDKECRCSFCIWFSFRYRIGKTFLYLNRKTFLYVIFVHLNHLIDIDRPVQHIDHKWYISNNSLQIE